jgi:hypothetical protein
MTSGATEFTQNIRLAANSPVALPPPADKCCLLLLANELLFCKYIRWSTLGLLRALDANLFGARQRIGFGAVLVFGELGGMS